MGFFLVVSLIKYTGAAYNFSPQALQSIIEAKEEQAMVTCFSYAQPAESNLLQF